MFSESIISKLNEEKTRELKSKIRGFFKNIMLIKKIYK